MPMKIIRNTIVNVKADAIVNSANPKVRIGSGVDTCIHKAAGPTLFKFREQIGEIRVGEVKITPGCNLDCKYVIHTVGPKWIDGKHEEESLLASCYKNSLHLAKEYECTSIAFPLISSGNYGIPKDLALRVASNAIQDFLFTYEMDVYLVVYDETSYQLSKNLSDSIESYMDKNYVDEQIHAFPTFFKRASRVEECYLEELTLEDMMEDMEDTFSESLMNYIIKKDLNEVHVYKKANMDRRLFSKIRSNKDYKPSKINAIALALALELDLEETKAFISKAGYSLTHTSKFDIIVEFFILNKNYNVFQINEALFKYNQPTIG